MCYIVVVLRDMVKERWWSATDMKHRKHDKTRVTCMQLILLLIKLHCFAPKSTIPHFPYAKPQKF